MENHMFATDDGALCDTRSPDWAERPLRPVYSRHYRDIDDTAKLRATLRAGPYAWPGGYPLYFITSDGAALSFDSVRRNLRLVLESICDAEKGYPGDGWRVVACEINFEDDSLYCDNSGELIPAAYASDESETVN